MNASGEERVSLPTKYATFIPVMLYYMAGYFWTNAYNANRTSYFDFSLPIDRLLPFHPAFILGYLLVFVLVVESVFLIETREDLRRGANAMVCTMTAGFLAFLLLPSTMVGRPVLDPSASWADWLCAFFFYLDEPHDLFPSMHLGMSVVCALLVLHRSRPLGILALALSAVVAVSVLLVHQHYVADVIAGTLLGGVGYRAGLVQDLTLGALKGWWDRIVSSGAPQAAGRG